MFFDAAMVRRFLLCLLVGAVLAAGCSSQDSYVDFVETDLAKSKIDDLSRAMDFITSEVRFEQREFKDSVNNGLNRWVTYSSDRLDEVPWTSDRTMAPLVEEYSQLPVCQRIDQFNFLITDAYFLQQAYWITLIVNRLADSQRVPPFEAYRLAAEDFDPTSVDKPIDEIFKRLNPSIETAEDSAKLANVVKVFDWVCRNINLESDAPLTDADIEERILDDSSEGPAAGVPGLGFQRFPWQTMMYGRGDFVERAKLMMLCLRYLKIDSVLLTVGPESKHWCVAVPIGQEYFLFDTQMGLPVPGNELGSIATLSMVRNSPQLLASLDLTTDESLADDTKYRVRATDLDTISGLLYASPDSISKRMNGLQSSLVGDNRMLVSYGLDNLKSSLPAIDGVEFKPWDIAFKTHQYRNAVRVAIEKNDSETRDKLRWYFRSEAYVDGFRTYRTARGRFFQGKFGAVINERSLNAIEGFRLIMYDDQTIASLAADENLQRRHGVRRDNQDAKDFDQLLSSVQGQMRYIRADSKLFLAQCLFDNGNETGINGWLDDLKNSLTDGSPDEPERWSDSVNYLLGRSYESGKQYDEAIQAFQAEDLNQTHGNILRARMLRQLIKKYYSEDVSTDN